MRNADINTLGEAMELGLGVELHQVTWDDLKVGCDHTRDTVMSNVLRRATIQESAITTISETVARGRRTISLQMRGTVDYHLKTKREEKTAPGIHILPVGKCLPTTPTSWIVLRKGSVLAPTVRVLVNRMMAAGLIELWISRFTPEGTRPAHRNVALAVKNLEPSWKLLALGHAVALLVFLGELAVFRRRPHPRAEVFTKLGSRLFEYKNFQ
ncbi:uncharacterized protein LOC113207460 [Frankliniella occidentalis]|uniref:Uncharacterized protein LOC113207460 n=1 Tax=Frankliniella occidentalis TaxID=133901 RepID=A0A6J1SMS3_FRAOC|nr:uncharacterized protein LOC113207460 [Frankliniella occidentalis]